MDFEEQREIEEIQHSLKYLFAQNDDEIVITDELECPICHKKEVIDHVFAKFLKGSWCFDCLSNPYVFMSMNAKYIDFSINPVEFDMKDHHHTQFYR
jgi:hypothetical protein